MPVSRKDELSLPPSLKPTRKVIILFHTAKRFYHFNIILTLELIIINFKKKLLKNLLVSFIFITLSYVNKKKQYYEQRRKSN